MTKTTEIAPGLSVAAQIEKADLAQLSGQGFKTIINNRPDSEGVPIAAAEAKAEAERLGLRYDYLPVTSSTITAADLVAFDKLVKDSPKPIVAHCRSGTRCYLLWATTQVVNGRADADALVAEAAAKGFDIKALPALAAKLKS
jgi:uncharacterized protein (TIGR01244 family)